MTPLPAAELDETLARLFAATPPATLLAIAESGRVLPFPPTVPLHGHQALTNVVSAMDLVVPDDVQKVVQAWMEARGTGVGTSRVAAAAAPSVVADLTFVDARHRYGVYLGFLLGAEPFPGLAPGAAADVLRPRFGVSHKSELAVFTHCDDGYLGMLGYRADQVLGRQGLELVHPDDHNRAIQGWMDLLAHPGASRRTRLRHRRCDGTWLWLEITNVNLLNDPARGCVVGETMDITEEMAATEALRDERELLARLTDALPVGVVQLGPTGTVRYRNDRLEAILGRPVAAGDTLDDLWPPDAGPSPGDRVREALAGGGDLDQELPVVRPDGTTTYVQLAVRALGGTGGVTGAVACLHDVTEAARLREELARQATFDGLTGCLTRRALLERLEIMLAGARPVTALFVDLDEFKAVNDRYGHAFGDALLRHVGTCLRDHLGDRGLVGRIGGDEFLVVTTAPGDDAAAARAAEDLGRVVAAPLLVDGERLAARASIGTARSGCGIEDADALVAAADGGMYRAKAARGARRHG